MKTTTSATAPEAFIASNRNRQKVYTIASGTSAPRQSIFLKGGQEFEIELFNPLQETVAAKIYLNGKAISNRLIVLKPGERTFLERFIDENRKLKFDTYEVENTEAASKAIEKNGLVRVEFFREQPATQPWYSPFSVTTVNNNYPFTLTNTGTSTGGYVFNSSTGDVVGARGFAGLSGPVGEPGEPGVAGAFYCADLGSVSYDANVASSATMDWMATEPAKKVLGKSVAKESIETGRIEGGAASSQHFDTYNGKFNSFYFAVTEFHIMPESQKPVEVNKIRNYCSNCGTRVRKSSWKFCPSCAAKLD